jgi:hypothetical protein
MKLAALLLLIPLMRPAPQQCIDGERVDRLVSGSKVIVLVEVAEVEEVGAIPWSGTGVIKQHVVYKVKNILKGNLSDSSIIVAHPLYQNSLSAGRKKPRLSPKLFKQGNSLLLFIGIGQQVIKQKDGSYQTVDEFVTTDVDCGAVVPHADLLNVVKGILMRQSP